MVRGAKALQNTSTSLPHAPLAALNAAVIDCETTGLDSRTARLVQVAAVRIRDGAVVADEVFDRLVDPGIAIPPGSSAIHGILDEHVRGAPRFAELGGQFGRFLGQSLLIGHSIAFDIAILKREFELAGQSWVVPRVLDIRLLGRLAAPTLAEYDLDRLCEWLGVPIHGRHTAIGDARATAEAFVKLVPLLRQRGIRTLAEAEAACVGLAERDARSSGGLMLVEAGAAGVPPAQARLDAFAYLHRVADVMTTPARVLPGSMTMGQAVAVMIEQGLSSVFVEMSDGRKGIVTERDALRAHHKGGPDAAATPLDRVANHPLLAIDAQEFVYRAIGRMDRLAIRHLAVSDASGAIVGALTPRNLLRNRATSSIVIGDKIATAATPAQLSACWGEVHAMAAALRSEGIDARGIASIISAEICAITARAADLAIELMRHKGHGEPPCAHAVLVLGSAGRGESLIAADQDNAIAFAEGEPGSPNDRWFEAMATEMNEILDQVGIIFCKGGVMAKTSEWRHSRARWTQLTASWVRRQKPQDLLNVDIFFDAVTVHGDRQLGDAVIAEAYRMGRQAPDFLMMLTELARRWHSPLNLFGRFQKEDGRVDLKKGGLMPLFTGARVLALRHGVDGRSTAERLRGVHARGIGSSETIEAIVAAHEVLLRTVLDQQVVDARRGVPLSPRVEVERLGKRERAELKSAIEKVPEMIDLVAEGRL